MLGLRATILTIFLVIAVCSVSVAWSQCIKVDKNDTTRWGGNERIVFNERRTFGQLRGRVIAYNNAENSLVEVFSHQASGNRTPKRIAACKTDRNGSFSLPRLPKGKYELRVSIDINWNVTYINVSVDPAIRRKKSLRVEMYLGT